MSEKLNRNTLIHTRQGEKWLSQFEDLDKQIAIDIANNLTLVSHTEFERNLLAKIEEVAANISGNIGLFAIREVAENSNAEGPRKSILPFYAQVTSMDGLSVNPLSPSADQGSEARIANIIRQFCRSRPGKFLNHPTLKELREKKCDAILFIDDLIGSGGRVHDFLTSFWYEKTIVSWLSGKQIAFHVIAYSATEMGSASIARHKSKPKIHIYRDAPTFENIYWSAEKRNEAKAICEKYGRIANKRRKSMWCGYKNGMVSLVFEHGCPNNTPAMLWEPNFEDSGWVGLFPNRTVSSEVASVFPTEIVRRDPIKVLTDAGQNKVANSGALLRRGETGIIILITLALIAKGKRKRSTISHATGLNIKDCEKIIALCIRWNFINVHKRISPKGLAELNIARRSKSMQVRSLDPGDEYYYPKQLREATYD